MSKAEAKAEPTPGQFNLARVLVLLVAVWVVGTFLSLGIGWVMALSWRAFLFFSAWLAGA